MNPDKTRRYYEDKFIKGKEQNYRARIVSAKLFAAWAADKIKLDDEQRQYYIKILTELSVRTYDFNPLIEHVKYNLHEVGIEMTHNELNEIILGFYINSVN